MNENAHPQDPRQALRKRLRQARAAVPHPLRHAASTALLAHAQAAPAFRRVRRVAGYVAVGSELDPAPLLDWLAARGAELHWPRLGPARGRMRFVAAPRAAVGHINRHGIPEPAPDAPAADARFLDVVLMPLVGFDAAGNRLGSGAGYYDRALAFRRQRRVWRAPLLVGIAYAAQEVPTLPPQPWDVPLDAVLTEQGWRRFPARQE